MKLPGGAFQVLNAVTAPSGLTEHQVRQFLAAEPLEQERLRGSLVRQVRASLEAASGGHTSVPDALVVEWMNTLMERKRSEAEWVQQLDTWMGVAVLFERLRAELVAQRLGIDDGLVRANTALHAGNLVQFARLLDAEIHRSEIDLPVARPDERFPLQRRLAGLLMLRAFMAELRLQQDLLKDTERVLELRHGDGDANVVALLLMAVDSAHLANKPDQSIGLLHSLRGTAEEKSQAAPSDVYW
ncbi:hypothetical protein ACVC7V_18260 [Hydrogenophaga sp. A37]|uniref:hypothetical protein n=1 Tax=Hydrogenophaga sp. A37 TaxID=1945864 RepID=UPI00117B5BCB|nr:hypothetical protein [Hydrogenophaga sp. A37]